MICENNQILHCLWHWEHWGLHCSTASTEVITAGNLKGSHTLCIPYEFSALGLVPECIYWLVCVVRVALLHWEPLNWVNLILFPPEILPRSPEGKSQLHLTSHWPIYTCLSKNEIRGMCGVWHTRSWKYSARADLHTLKSQIKAQSETFNHLDSAKLWMHKKGGKQGIH